LNWVNRIAVVTLLFGAAFFFKYAVDNNWIGPGTRVAMGILAALGSLAAADRLWRKGHKVFAQGIAGLGLALFYLSFWAAASFYELVPQAVSFVLMAVTTLGAGQLALRYESQAIAVMGLLGGYLTPWLLSTGENRPWILFGYLFLLNLGGMVRARMRRWLALEPLALAATVVYYAGWASAYPMAANRLVATVSALAFYAQFAASPRAALWTPVQLLAPVALAGIWDREARFLPFEVALGVSGLVVAEVRKWRAAPSWTLVCFWLPFWMWSVSSNPADVRGPVFAWLSLAFILFFLWAPWWSLWNSRPPRMGDVLVSLGNAFAYFAASYWLLNPVRPEYMGLLAVAIGGLHLGLAKALWKPPDAPEREMYPGLIAAGIAMSFATLAVPVQFTGFRITMAWAAEGAGLAWIAGRFRNGWFAGASAAVLTLTVLRLAVSDSWMYRSVTPYAILANARFLTMAVAAVALWLAARFLHRGFGQRAWTAGAAYVAGHAAMLWALALELGGWTDRAFTSANAGSVFTAGLSILMALYALLLVTLGVGTRTAANRFLGLGLIGIVVLKLYLWDVWQLGRIFRVAAFLALGAMLLAVSYLYSRFRPSIERWWKQEAVEEPPPVH
jgi:hypothetical protein